MSEYWIYKLYTKKRNTLKRSKNIEEHYLFMIHSLLVFIHFYVLTKHWQIKRFAISLVFDESSCTLWANERINTIITGIGILIDDPILIYAM